MKILMVAIPNHHFFQWVNQLKASGHDVFWFDVTDGGPKSHKINWIKQIKGWKLRWDFPLRTRLKKKAPKLYTVIQKVNENSVSKAFKRTIENIQPDIVHCFEMQLSGLPILDVMERNMTPFIYSSWGSDVFNFKEKGVAKEKLQQFYNRVNYLITDCIRDSVLATQNGYKNTFLGVFPGNGGIELNTSCILPANQRNIILIKGYDDGIGKASILLKALEVISFEKLKDKKIVIYSADSIIEEQVKSSMPLSKLNIKIHSRYQFIQNSELLNLMGQSCIHIANSLSDGIPNALLEAMGMGAFPIQSNPGKVTEEVIINTENGFLIENPLDETHIAKLIRDAIENDTLRETAQVYNTSYIQKKYNRSSLQPEIIKLYESVKVPKY